MRERKRSVHPQSNVWQASNPHDNNQASAEIREKVVLKFTSAQHCSLCDYSVNLCEIRGTAE